MVKVRVEFDYTASADDELTLKVGDVITEVQKQGHDGGWWEGVLHGKRGVFPDNFVREIVEPIATVRNCQKVLARVIFSYEPNNADELKLQEGDVVEVLGKEDEGWWKGSLDGNVGVFPSNFVELMDAADQAQNGEEDRQIRPTRFGFRNIFSDGSIELPSQGGGIKNRLLKKNVMARVTFSYEPNKKDELKLKEGDVVEVLGQHEEGWWQGSLDGNVGVFPSNFVELMDDADQAQNGEEDKQPKRREIEEKTVEPIATVRNCQNVLARVIFSYEPSNIDELKLQEGDVVEVLGKEDEGWWQGSLDGNVGVFPSSFVILVSNADQAQNGEEDRQLKRREIKEKTVEPIATVRNCQNVYARVIFPYEPSNEDELKLQEGNVVEVLGKEQEGWWKGSLDGNVGVFHSNFVKLVNDADQAQNGEEDRQLKRREIKEKTVEPIATVRNCQNVYARVIFPYEPSNEDELRLKEGDVVEVLGKEQEGWWKGSLDGNVGVFHSNFVKLVNDADQAQNGEEDRQLKRREIKEKTVEPIATVRNCQNVYARVIFPYEPSNEDELRLKEGDVVEVLGKEQEGWWKGSLDGNVGVFHSNFVKLVNDADQAQNGEEDRQLKRREIKEKTVEPIATVRNCQNVYARVIFPYEPSNEDELRLKEGDVVEVLGKEQEGWWKGSLDGNVGVFPSNFVKLVNDADQAQNGEEIRQTRPKGFGLGNISSDGSFKLPSQGEGTKREPLKENSLARVIFSYQPTREDELSLQEGQVVEVLKQEEEGWWQGCRDGKVGKFPSNFVELMDVANQA